MRQSRADLPPGTLPMLSTFDRALIRVNRWVVIAILAAMAVMVFANVALRFLPTTRSSGSRRCRAT